MRSRLARKLGLVALSLAAACAAGELVARTALGRRPPRLAARGAIFERALGSRRHDPHPQIGWVLAEAPVESRHTLERDGATVFDVAYTIAGGRRRTARLEQAAEATSSEPRRNQAAEAKSADPRREPAVLCTGCSFTFGHGLADDATWPWLLQERLADLSVVNVACMAYGTDQALMAAERELARMEETPRVVLLGFADFQIERVRSPQGWLVHVYPFAKPFWTKDGAGVRLAGTVSFHSFGPALGGLLGRSVLASYAWSEAADLVRGTPDHEEAREVAVRLIRRFADNVAARGAVLGVLVLPTHRDEGAQSKSDRAFVVEWLRREEIPVLEILIERRADGGVVDGYWIDAVDRHPNRRYNELVAEQAAAFVAEMLVPTTGR